MRPRLLVRVGRGVVRAEVVKAGVATWAAEGAFRCERELEEALGALAGEATLAPRIRTAHVELERPLVQVRHLHDLPPVRSGALAALVATQAGRFFRRNGTPLVTAAAWSSRKHGARGAVAAAVEEPWLAAIVAGLQAAGLTVHAICPVGTSSLLLLPRDEGVRRARAARRRNIGWGILAAALWLAVGMLAVWRTAREMAAVDRELARLRPTGAALLAARREYKDARAMIGVVDSADRLRGSVSTAVATVLLALPDSAFVTTLRLNDRAEGELSGAARRTAAVTAALERNGAVVAPRLVRPTTRDVIGGREYERFTLRFGADSGR
ncbi:MAG TPA: hypothetical protein VFS33_04210 [Gemmatimonadales bacterium]|nr:hypothetical protein [Gemmatimonadales bacterium]